MTPWTSASTARACRAASTTTGSKTVCVLVHLLPNTLPNNNKGNSNNLFLFPSSYVQYPLFGHLLFIEFT